MQNFILNISQRAASPVIDLKQGDVGRKFKIILTDDGAAYTVPEGTLFSVWFSGPNGEGNYSTIDDRPAVTVEENVATVEVIAGMVQTPGVGLLCLVLNSPDGNQLGTWNIPYSVEMTPGVESPEVTQYYTALSEVAGLAAASAAEARKSAATFVTDTTLSVLGKAADSATTGARLREVHEAITVERSRINALATLPEGSTTGDAELMDIRVDYMGNSHETAGESVRSQCAEFAKELFDTVKIEEEEIPLVFSNSGWYDNNGVFHNTADGVYCEIAIKHGEKYRLKGSSRWSMTPFVVLDSTGAKLYSAPVSGNATLLTVEEEIIIPAGGTRMCFTAETGNSSQQNQFLCIKYVTVKGQSRIEKLEDAVVNSEQFVMVINPVVQQIAEFSNPGFYTSNLKLNTPDGYKHSKTAVMPGLKYYVKYWSQYTTTMVVTDASGKALLAGQVSDSSAVAWFEDEITIPADGAFIYLSSADTTWDDNRNAQCQIIKYEENRTNVGQYALEQIQKANILYGKKWVACGDSFTHGSLVDPDENPFFEEGIYLGKRKTYPYFIGLRNGMTIVNEAISGSTMALDKDYVDGVEGVEITENNPFSYERYMAVDEDADYITLWFGINDGNNCRLGTIDDSTNETFYGAWNIVLEWLIENRPNAKIGIIVTNLSYPGFRQAIRDVAHKWGIPYLDMEGDYQTPPIVDGREDNMGMCERARELRANHFRISSDNSHPTVNAHRYESTFIEAFLRRL